MTNQNTHQNTHQDRHHHDKLHIHKKQTRLSIKWLSVCLIALILLTSVPFTSPASYAIEAKINDWPLLEKSIQYADQKDYAKAVYYWEELVKLYGGYTTLYAYENGGHIAKKAGDYYAGEIDPKVFDSKKATYYYEKAYNSYLNFSALSGSTVHNWAFVSVKKKLDDIKSELILYVKKDMATVAPLSRPLAKHEPASGLFIGVYGEGNKALFTGFGVDPAKIESVYGKQHASLLYYNNFGDTPFATKQAENMKAIGGSLQIHMQPLDLDKVVDGVYIRQFAKDAKASGIPIFLRFGGEMNGDWTPWGMQPKKYIEKFKLVHDIMEQDAPNVAMVWAPNFHPWDNMAEYYPGDAYVDWVGVSCYTTLGYTAENKETKLKSNPIDLLSHIVSDYGKRKPIMIVEGAVSNFSTTEPKIDYTDWAINNIKRFYAYIPLVYPEIKAMYYYDAKGVAGARESYVLSDNTRVKLAYNEIIKSDFYLSKMDQSASYKYEKISATLNKGKVTLASYVKSYEPVISKVEYYVNNALVSTSTKIPFEFTYDFTKVGGSSATITVKAYLADGKIAAVEDYAVTLTQPAIKVLYKNSQVSFDQPPVVVGGRTLVPMKKIFETFGMTVTYDSATKTILAKDSVNTIALTIGSDKVTVNGNQVVLDVPASVIAGRTMVPLKFVGQSIGLKVAYDSASRTITIQ